MLQKIVGLILSPVHIIYDSVITDQKLLDVELQTPPVQDFSLTSLPFYRAVEERYGDEEWKLVTACLRIPSAEISEKRVKDAGVRLAGQRPMFEVISTLEGLMQGYSVQRLKIYSGTYWGQPSLSIRAIGDENVYASIDVNIPINIPVKIGFPR